MSEQTELDEKHLILRDSARDAVLCEKAREIWRQSLGSVRASCCDRLDRGIPRGKQDLSCRHMCSDVS